MGVRPAFIISYHAYTCMGVCSSKPHQQTDGCFARGEHTEWLYAISTCRGVAVLVLVLLAPAQEDHVGRPASHHVPAF